MRIQTCYITEQSIGHSSILWDPIQPWLPTMQTTHLSESFVVGKECKLLQLYVFFNYYFTFSFTSQEALIKQASGLIKLFLTPYPTLVAKTTLCPHSLNSSLLKHRKQTTAVISKFEPCRALTQYPYSGASVSAVPWGST